MDCIYWDIAAVIWLVVFFSLGAKKGIILSVGTLVLTALGYMAGYWALANVAPQMSVNGFLDAAVTNFLVFIVAFLLVRIGGGLLLRLLNQMGKLPVLKQLNRLGGGIAGLLKGVLLLLLVGQVMALIGLTPESSALTSTMVAKYFFTGFL